MLIAVCVDCSVALCFEAAVTVHGPPRRLAGTPALGPSGGGWRPPLVRRARRRGQQHRGASGTRARLGGVLRAGGTAAWRRWRRATFLHGTISLAGPRAASCHGRGAAIRVGSLAAYQPDFIPGAVLYGAGGLLVPRKAAASSQGCHLGAVQEASTTRVSSHAALLQEGVRKIKLL